MVAAFGSMLQQLIAATGTGLTALHSQVGLRLMSMLGHMWNISVEKTYSGVVGGVGRADSDRSVWSAGPDLAGGRTGPTLLGGSLGYNI